MFIRRNKTQKNIIEFGEIEEKTYKFDISKNHFIGLRGKEIKCLPRTVIKNLQQCKTTDNAIKDFLKIAKDTYNYELFNYFDIIEKIDNILKCSICDNSNLSFWMKSRFETIKKNLKSALKYISQQGEFYANDFDDNGNFYIDLYSKRLNLSPYLHSQTKQILIKYNDLIKYAYDIDILVKYHMTDAYCIKQFAEKCEFINEPLYNNKYNFIKYYDYIYTQYENKKDKLLDFNLNKNQNKKLFFENENFTMIIPTTAQQFKEEAEYQQNCVFNTYLKYVALNQTNVVFIRKKEDINTPYITCEITKDFTIKQYLTRFNRQVRDEMALEFKEQLKQFLESLKEIKEL